MNTLSCYQHLNDNFLRNCTNFVVYLQVKYVPGVCFRPITPITVLIHITVMKDFDEIIKSSTPTLVDFFGTWCGPCRMQAPILERVKEKIGDNGTIIKIDVDRNRELAARFHVQSVPTLIMFRNGEAVWRAVGVQQADVLESKFHDLG